MMKLPFILIPAYKPDEKIIELVDSLIKLGLTKIIVVRDGGGEEYNAIFDSIKNKGCILLMHEVNKGKGAALKTGFQYYLQNHQDEIGLVTADADGQHLPQDIFNVANALVSSEDNLILGSRVFDKKVPFRSKFGNILTRKIFHLLIGKKISDTQTGLRGIPTKFLAEFIKLKGEQYEYEINMLASTKRLKIGIKEVLISTVYIENNRSSHFNPILDSIKIYALLFRFSVSGLVSFVFDYSLFALLMFFGFGLAASSYGARTFSMILNFFLNKNLVFLYKGKKQLWVFTKYFLTCLFSISISYFLLLLILKQGGISIFLAKILIEIILFFVNFYIQDKFVFKK